MLLTRYSYYFMYIFREQLQNVSLRLEEEKDRRLKIEQELEKYKQFINYSESSLPANKVALQNMFNQFYNSYLNGDSKNHQM